MRYAIFSDIHSNLEGLEAVLREAERCGADRLLCCGDIIGYNANPVECTELVREKGVRCIRGNHERGLVDLEAGNFPNMNPLAMAALHFTAEALPEEHRRWLVSLPDVLRVNDCFYLFHGSPSDPDEYIFDPFEAGYAFKSLLSDYPPPANLLCFIGHTHVCAAYSFDPERRKVRELGIRPGNRESLLPGSHYILNVGSCGQYRGGIPVATMALMDLDEMWVEFRFLEYDYRSTQKKVLAAGLPVPLAVRLGMGQ
ncbi:metallophosphoesterase family protein [Candidatus Solincola tengchongensis]|uniref:metallophosphoesterase family protein n=1 Tax=Candidatus Solincola tengchongensis TaxID=2900693 RepID=UPI00257B043B|nr:metallophosphoesterase family protein [Candidatus Solincola tengchongensis]